LFIIRINVKHLGSDSAVTTVIL